MGELPLHQTSVLLYINERTLRYGKLEEHINRTHFLDGVKDSHGNVLHNGINIAHTPLWKYVRLLGEIGLVRVTHLPRNRRGNIYALDIEEVLKPVIEGKLKTATKSKNRGRQRRRISAKKGGL